MKIAIIGAGPRGIILVERLLTQLNTAHIAQEITIDLFDEAPIGGRVWDPFLPANRTNIMNTVASQVTLFYDDTIDMDQSFTKGPSLYEWMQKEAKSYLLAHPEYDSAYLKKIELGPNDYPARGLVGIYAAWYFDQLLENKNPQILFHKHHQLIEQISQNRTTNHYELTTNGGQYFAADQVVMALGHPLNPQITPENQKFTDFANKFESDGLTYSGTVHPSEVDLTNLPANPETVILRGLGLSYFDYVTQLTQGRGGKITENSDGWFTYNLSDREPHMIVGSRRGLPLKARGLNQKAPDELYQARFFTLENLAKLKNEAGKISYSDFYDLFNKEIQYKHYEAVADLSPEIDKTTFLAELENSDARDYLAAAKKYHVSADYWFEWNQILHGNQSDEAKAASDYQQWLINYLKKDVICSEHGNKQAPFASAYDILRDLREIVRTVVENDWFDTTDYQAFLKDFNPLDVLLSVGPPNKRLKEMIAYMEAGILTVVGPGMQVTTNPETRLFEVRTDRPEEFYTSQHLVEARLTTTSVEHAQDPLIKQLKADQMIKQINIQDEAGELNLDVMAIDKPTFAVQNTQGEPLDGLYSFGIPHENWKWFTTILPRPGVKTLILQEAAAISQEILDHLSV